MLPLPKTLPRANESMLVVYGVPLAFYLGALLVYIALNHRGRKLRRIADKAQETLDLQVLLLKQLEAQGQIIDVGGIHGKHYGHRNEPSVACHEGRRKGRSLVEDRYRNCNPRVDVDR